MQIKAQAKWLENTRDFPSEKIQLGYRLRSPLPSGVQIKGMEKGDRLLFS